MTVKELVERLKPYPDAVVQVRQVAVKHGIPYLIEVEATNISIEGQGPEVKWVTIV
jgi:hypothetical protein